LSEEPMYFNQLAKEIGIGQQAIIRHLRVLEDIGIIETYGEKSEFGAPERKYYRLNTSFVLTVLLSEHDFTISKHEIKQLRHKASKKYYESLDSIPGKVEEALSLLQKNLADIEEEISTLESRLTDLFALKQAVLRKLHEIGMDNFDAEERRILYKIVEQPPRSIAKLSDIISAKESSVKDLVEMEGRMGKDDAQLLFGKLK
ncbi:MAG TPA: ArsR family transcriptional regulator, partial [Nitrososphaera sp.]|nr:ArsR family transcriptional regulator [Nitrososphaera sp.]